ncbi:MAG: aspartyl/glutamyl-tRNA amidotransferase subunit C [Candidatus Shapirobacteria bacterium]|nr:aspartyl/glutamyl-tRNA amidotransferase subunit C [Candidatus Shapirobacteria bacterium]MDD5073722.1 aspartyl/glutamyl-tRNA amidotransferase subunit C [Candidatus Shapirobacteria bacterium]MDD5481711.1 aspartyl/glutamyl-tRNA amidotransferase subunit C [Candidatus Shapirobacteria bacterium]
MSQKRKSISVDHLEKLANLKIKTAEKSAISSQLEETIRHFAVLDRMSGLAKEKPTFQVTANTNIVAEDKTRPCLSREKILPAQKKFFTTDND